MPLPALLLPLLCSLLAAAPAIGVLIDPGDGTGNTSAPPDDPGWDHVGKKVTGILTVVYAGNGWVITADHVGTGTVEIMGTEYPAESGTKINFQNSGVPAGQEESDEAVYRLLKPWPPLPILPLASAPPPIGTEVIMIGHGRNRGAFTDPCIDLGAGPDVCGYAWAGGKTKRWGTNEIESNDTFDEVCSGSCRYTWTLKTDFSNPGDPFYTSDESQVVTGDSGGALFAPDGSGGWELAGTLYARSEFTGQPEKHSLYGNETLAADLAAYRDAIVAIIRPDCSDEVDNDADTDTDLDDDGCENLEDLTEEHDCQDGIDNDDDGLIDLADLGCGGASDGTEKDSAWICDNGIDDDLDGRTDYPWDVGCGAPNWPTENPQCSDGVDNDGDLEIDWDGGAYFNGGVPIADVDEECTNQPFRNKETPNSTGGGGKTSGCGLGGPLLAAVLPGLLALRRRTGT